MRRFGLLLPMAVFAVAAVPGHAAEATQRHFSISPQALPGALIAFGQQAGVQVLTAGGAVASLRTSGVQGDCTPEAALTKLLQGTGLVASFVDADTVVVKPAPASPRADAPAAAASPTVRQLAPVTATGVVDQAGYLVELGGGVTRVDTSLLDLPAAVSEIPHELLDSQQASTVADAVRNVAGVLSLDGADALPVFLVRGFQVGNGMLDGLPNSISAYGAQPPLVGIERVEVLKGPQAIVGDVSVNNNFGGLVNLVLKQPVATPVRRLDFGLGQYGGSRLGLDLGGPLGKSGRWSYRLIASGEYADRTRQGRRGQRDAYLAPSLGWQGDGSHLVLSVQQLVRREPIPDYAVMLGHDLGSTTPPGLMTGNPGDHSLFRSSRFSYAFERRLSPRWTLRSRGQYVRQDSRVHTWDLGGFSPNGDAFPLAEAYHYGDAYYTVQNDLLAHLGRGAIRHVVVFGFDYARALSGRVDDVFSALPQGSYNLYAGPPLPPVSTVAGSATAPTVALYAPGDPWTANHAWFLQDQLALGEHWRALLALRRESYKLATVDADGHRLDERRAQWVPNAGLLYRLNTAWSLYASATSGFQPDQVLGKGGRPLPPTHSRQLEAGSKLMLFDRSAMLTVAVYRSMLDHRNNLSSPRPPYYGIPGPGQDNRGLELEFNGRPLPGLDLSSAYAHAIVSNHDGSPPTGAPRQRFNLWASYRFQHGVLRGWGLAGGVLARSASRGEFGDGSGYFAIPGQARVDANVSWCGGPWRVALGVRNLFDRNLRDAEFDETFVPLHRGREVLLSGSLDF
jgi:iron complex outermembrane receptor protein